MGSWVLISAHWYQPHAAQVVRARSELAAVLGSIEAVEWMLSLPPGFSARPPGQMISRIDKPLRFEAVGYTYPGKPSVLRGIDFTIEPGSAVALIGASGAGKSTLVNLLCGLLPASDGRILLGDTPLDSINIAAWRRLVAFAGQDATLVDGSVAENIAYGWPGADPGTIEHAARVAGASTFIAHLPQGYVTHVGAGGLALSGGQRQRIGLARALIRRPELLILDEATSAIDAPAENEIMALLSARNYFRTAIVVSHRRSTLAMCDYGIVLDQGRLVEAGPLPDLAYYKRMGGERA